MIGTLLDIGGTFFTLLGMLTVLYWFKTPQSPADKSNIIARITSWWIGLTRPDVLAKSYKFFRQDMMDNINDIEGKGD